MVMTEEKKELREKPLLVRLTESEMAILERYCRRKRLSKSEAIRQYIRCIEQDELSGK